MIFLKKLIWIFFILKISTIQQTQTPPPTHDSITSVNRATFAAVQSSSVGFFIPSDSAYGNSILPVLPRFD